MQEKHHKTCTWGLPRPWGQLSPGSTLVQAGMMLCRPSTSAMLRALELLLALGALDAEGALTPLGRQMVRLPVEPVFAKVRQHPPGLSMRIHQSHLWATEHFWAAAWSSSGDLDLAACDGCGLALLQYALTGEP